MLIEELLALVESIRLAKAEGQTIEVKAAHDGCPKRLYDTLSSFSNQDDGGIIVFGLDETKGFEPVGVYDAQDLQKHVVEQCNQMTPVVRAVFTTACVEGKTVVSAEIPAIDVAERPCFYSGKGRVRGAYVRVGESDEPMTEYKVYSYEAFRKKYQDEIEPVRRATLDALDPSKLARYLLQLKSAKPNLSRLDDGAILELMSVVRDGVPTLAGIMLLSIYPQAFFPQLAVVATVLPGDELGTVGPDGSRFDDNKRVEGTLGEQLAGALAFVRANTRTSTRVDPQTGRRVDQEDYPMEAVRELVLNALVHRDYSVHTQGMPIQLQLFPDRLVISNPGGLYGRMNIDDLGKMQPDTRNPVIATAMETMGETENRYSGIPTVRRLMAEAGLPEPLFESARGEFRATLYRRLGSLTQYAAFSPSVDLTEVERRVVVFCDGHPRSRGEIAELLGVQPAYAIRRYVGPLVERGVLWQTVPDAPKSPRQRYVTAEGVVLRG